MITLPQYWMGRDQQFASVLTEEIRQNAIETVARSNRLLSLGGFEHLDTISSGWRPEGINAGVANAAKGSRHIYGQAIDIRDLDRMFARWCCDNTDALADVGLWMEHPDWTYSRFGNHWVHLQVVPPRSGRRIFIPSANSPLAPEEERFGEL